jgi:hypothetical protein
VHTAILYLTLALQASVATPAPPANSTDREARIRQMIGDIASSGRVLNLNNTKERLADPRKQIAPGAPPLLSFRYFDGADRHRFGKLDVIMDDAGH